MCATQSKRKYFMKDFFIWMAWMALFLISATAIMFFLDEIGSEYESQCDTVDVVQVSSITDADMLSYENPYYYIDDNHYEVSFRGKHCDGIVGCSCQGFEPMSGEVWKRGHCKHCGHKKTFHK